MTMKMASFKWLQPSSSSIIGGGSFPYTTFKGCHGGTMKGSFIPKHRPRYPLRFKCEVGVSEGSQISFKATIH